MTMPIHVRNPDGTPYQIQSVVTPSRKLSPEDLYKAGAITSSEYLSRTGRIQPAGGLSAALMPRANAANDAGTLQQLLSGVSDVASLPGRAYASLGRPSGESYLSALARVAASPDEGGADRFSEGVLRDPVNILAPVGLSAVAKIPAVARGLVAAGKFGQLGADVAANTAAQAVANRAIVEDTGIPQSAAMNLAFALGAHGLSGIAKRGMQMISPEERAANFKNWFGDSKVVDDAGNPLIVYHGTSQNFDSFNPKKIGSNYGMDKKGIFLSSDQNVAHNAAIDSYYASGGGENIMPMHVKADNPMRPNINSAEFDDSDKLKIITKAKKSGNDAIILNDGTYIVFNPTQIKSATGNRGTFDPNDPNITHFAGGPAYPQSLASIAASRIINSGKQAAAMKAQDQ